MARVDRPFPLEMKDFEPRSHPSPGQGKSTAAQLPASQPQPQSYSQSQSQSASGILLLHSLSTSHLQLRPHHLSALARFRTNIFPRAAPPTKPAWF
ncbi:hypothetical protein E4U43_006508 [Claviceps pusilla]|uniref:Uncharacterized protein n=1 Tax=Claviceps pusilla TaxID=123648 RepID=A0A9P7T269_9HYPO|nr:hypothetical protein E4U43_006508 [Claviceps pusilla]